MNGHSGKKNKNKKKTWHFTNKAGRLAIWCSFRAPVCRHSLTLVLSIVKQHRHVLACSLKRYKHTSVSWSLKHHWPSLVSATPWRRWEKLHFFFIPAITIVTMDACVFKHWQEDVWSHQGVNHWPVTSQKWVSSFLDWSLGGCVCLFGMTVEVAGVVFFLHFALVLCVFLALQLVKYQDVLQSLQSSEKVSVLQC